jgi:hypothetical protein
MNLSYEIFIGDDTGGAPTTRSGKGIFTPQNNFNSKIIFDLLNILARTLY